MDLAHHAVKIRAELLDIGLHPGRKEDAGRIGTGDPALLQVVERI